MSFISSLVFNSTISKEQKDLLLLMAPSTYVSLIYRPFSTHFHGLIFRGLGGIEPKMRLQLLCLNAYIFACPS